ncbi:MAG: hypothetical protein K9K38_14070 [Rhodoferax sp.]|nr:hypothetical protein [Rhodoferax sp.]MCF8210507.1 hypothetical protein [Rhodoferax sp.]
MPRLLLFIFCIAFLFAAGGWFKTGMVLFALDFGLLHIWIGWVMLQGLLNYQSGCRLPPQANFYDQE